MDAARTAERELAARRVRGPLHGIPVGGEGHHRRRRPADHLPFAHPARQRRAGGRGGDRPAAPGGRDHPRQDRHPRIRHRRAELRPAVPAGAQSVEPGPSPGRIVLRLGRRGGGGAVPRGARFGHRRVGAQPGELLRHRRAEADLRAGVAPRGVPALLHLGPCRSADPHGGGHGADARRDGRARPGRPRQRARPRPAVRGRARSRRARPAHRLRPPFPRDRPARPSGDDRRAGGRRPPAAGRGRGGPHRHPAQPDRVRGREPGDPDLRGLVDARALAARPPRRLRAVVAPPPAARRLHRRRGLCGRAAPPGADDRRGGGRVARGRYPALRQLDGSGEPDRGRGGDRAHLSAPGAHPVQRHRPPGAGDDGGAVAGGAAAVGAVRRPLLPGRDGAAGGGGLRTRARAGTRAARRSADGGAALVRLPQPSLPQAQSLPQARSPASSSPSGCGCITSTGATRGRRR